MKLIRKTDEKVGYQVSPLIDVVFLLLIYFMVTSSLIRKEGDVAFSLPGPPGPHPFEEIPVQVQVEIVADGAVEMDGVRYTRHDLELDGLREHLAGLKRMADMQRSDFFVTIVPHKDALHQRVMDVMDACSGAGVTSLGFGRSI